MFTVPGEFLPGCDRSTRRGFLRVGALGAFGLHSLSLAKTLPAADGIRDANFGRARRCLLLFLTGGPSQLDTFDPKPGAPAEVRGEFQSISTCVAGTQITELFPRLAQRADKFCIVRSVTHGDTVHTSAGYTMLTGVVHPLANSATASLIRPTAADHPHLGAVLSLAKPAANGRPVFAALPEVIKDAAVNEFPGQGAGLLGKQYDPLLIEADTRQGVFLKPDLVPALDVSETRLLDRAGLLRDLDRLSSPSAAVREFSQLQERSVSLLRTREIQEAFDIARESERHQAEYGSHLFGRGCLLARRLLEAGVSLVTVYWHYEGPDDSPVWDTHWNNFRHLRERLAPPTDQALASLFDDLSARGLLDDTLVVCLGEFGRTPRINVKAGRDHWPHVQSLLLAGAGIRAGSVYGASDRIAAYPHKAPLSPADLVATIFHLLGVPAHLELHDQFNRPIVACQGQPALALLSG